MKAPVDLASNVTMANVLKISEKNKIESIATPVMMVVNSMTISQMLPLDRKISPTEEQKLMPTICMSIACQKIERYIIALCSKQTTERSSVQDISTFLSDNADVDEEEDTDVQELC